MGPWGQDMPVTPDRYPVRGVSLRNDHCPDLCCDSADDCRCDCSWCDCRYAVRQGS